MTDEDRPRRLQLRKEPAQGRSRATVDAILEAAARVLVERGYEEMNTNLVAEAAGVSVGSLYQYFPHKDSLIAELIDRRADAEREFMAQWIAGLEPTSLEVVFERVVRGTLAFRATDPEVHGALLRQMPHIGRFDQLRIQVEAVTDRLLPLLEAFRHELPGGDVQMARFVLVNTIHSLTHDGVLQPPSGVDDDRLTEAVMRIVRGYLLGPGEPPGGAGPG